MFFIKNSTKSVIMGLTVLLLLVGCASREITTRTLTSSQKASAEAILKRAGEFKQVIAPLAVAAVAIHPEQLTVEQDQNPDSLVADLLNLGVNKVYYHLPVKSDLDERLVNFLAAAARAKLPVELVIKQTDYFRAFRGGSLIRPLIPEKTTLEEMAQKIVEFNLDLPEGDRIAGLTVIIAPHEFTSANRNRPKHLVYAWSPNTFGPGLDNDQLILYTFKQLEEVANIIGDLPLTVGVPDFYHQLCKEGKISKGKVSDFLEIKPEKTRVLIQNRGNKASEAVAAIALELTETIQAQSIICQLTLANHTSVSSGAFRRRDWSDLVRNLRYLIGKWQSSSSFAGLVIDPWAHFELIQQEE